MENKKFVNAVYNFAIRDSSLSVFYTFYFVKWVKFIKFKNRNWNIESKL